MRWAVLAAAMALSTPVSAETAGEQDVETALRQMQEMMQNLPPEQRRMMEQAMQEAMQQTPSQSTPPFDEDESVLPSRDEKRLAKISREPLTGPQLQAFVESLQPKLRQALSAQALQRAEAVESAEVQAGGDASARLRAAANGLATMGAWPEATFLLGKVALASGGAQDLNNLAAFLTMQQAPQAALPILITLDARYPDNSTILNNLGQAWFELGEIEEAKRTLWLAVRFAPTHPQANVTKSRIEEAEGDKQATQVSMRQAIRGGYSKAKQQRLERLGGKLQPGDLSWSLPMPQDPLGLHKLGPPPYPMTIDELPSATKAWENFLAQAATLGFELNQGFATRQVERTNKPLEIGGGTPPLAAKASVVYAFDIDVIERKLRELTREVQQQQTGLQSDWMETGQHIAEIRSRCSAQPNFGGEGCGCGEINKLVGDYLSRWNGRLQPLQQEWLEWKRKKADADAYFAQFTSPDEALYNDSNRMARASYVNTLANLKAAGVLNAELDYCRPAQKKPTRSGGKLANFDDVHCMYVSEMVIPGIGTIKIRCNRMETTLEPAMANFKVSWTEDMNQDRVISASAEISREVAEGVKVSVGAHGEFDEQGLKSGGVGVKVDAGVGEFKRGPLKAGMGVHGGVGVEFDRGGITDVRIDAGIGESASSTVAGTEDASPGVEAKIGVDSSWSWNAGTSTTASARFDRSFF